MTDTLTDDPAPTPQPPPAWYTAEALRSVAYVIRQKPGISDAELLALWAAYNAPGAIP